MRARMCVKGLLVLLGQNNVCRACGMGGMGWDGMGWGGMGFVAIVYIYIYVCMYEMKGLVVSVEGGGRDGCLNGDVLATHTML